MQSISSQRSLALLWIARLLIFTLLLINLTEYFFYFKEHHNQNFLQIVRCCYQSIATLILWIIYENYHHINQRSFKLINRYINKRKQTTQNTASFWQEKLGTVWHEQLKNVQTLGYTSNLSIIKFFDTVSQYLLVSEKYLSFLRNHIKSENYTFNSETIQNLKEVIKNLDDRNIRLRVQADETISALQTQDRVSQILQHVMDSLHNLNEHLCRTHRWPHRPEIELFNAMLLASYATPEEFTAHSSNSPTNSVTHHHDEDLIFF